MRSVVVIIVVRVVVLGFRPRLRCRWRRRGPLGLGGGFTIPTEFIARLRVLVRQRLVRGEGAMIVVAELMLMFFGLWGHLAAIGREGEGSEDNHPGDQRGDEGQVSRSLHL
jgi:hypothetical protein